MTRAVVDDKTLTWGCQKHLLHSFSNKLLNLSHKICSTLYREIQQRRKQQSSTEGLNCCQDWIESTTIVPTRLIRSPISLSFRGNGIISVPMLRFLIVVANITTILWTKIREESVLLINTHWPSMTPTLLNFEPALQQEILTEAKSIEGNGVLWRKNPQMYSSSVCKAVRYRTSLLSFRYVLKVLSTQEMQLCDQKVIIFRLMALELIRRRWVLLENSQLLPRYIMYRVPTDWQPSTISSIGALVPLFPILKIVRRKVTLYKPKK